MAKLYAWQKLTRVLPGRPYGTGADGAYSSSTAPTMTKESFSGTIDTYTITVASAVFANGDILDLWQTRGTGWGQREVNRVVSGGGTTTLTLQKPLKYTYTDSGASQAQATKILQYTDVTISSGTWATPAWDQNKGGLLTFACSRIFTPTGGASANGSNGSSGGDNTPGATGGGFYGGRTDHQNPSQSFTGEGVAGVQTGQSAANANAGGGSNTSGPSGGGGGGGGGNATAGGGWNGGGTASSADLTVFSLGGGGGGGANDGSESGSPTGSGASGGAAIIIYARTIASPTGTITANGGNGGNAQTQAGEASCGGGGAGGSILIVTQTANVGTSKFLANGGTGGINTTSGIKYGGDGGSGAIAIHYGLSITGTTSPSATVTKDVDLIEGGGAALFALL